MIWIAGKKLCAFSLKRTLKLYIILKVLIMKIDSQSQNIGIYGDNLKYLHKNLHCYHSRRLAL